MAEKTNDVVLKVAGISKRFGGLQALSDVGITIQRGQVYGLIGPNGAGKTTLVRAVLGLLKPHSGTVWRKPKLRVGYMPQSCMWTRHCRSPYCASCAWCLA